jgi:phage-related protein (TIGR01555 family)
MANGWGGHRNGSGRKRTRSNVIPFKAKPKLIEATAIERPRPMFSDESVRLIIEAMSEQQGRARNRPRTPDWNPYIIRQHLFGASANHIARHKPQMAMDANPALADANAVAVQAWQTGGLAGNDAAEGLLFLGYPFLSEMAQRAEFRLFGEIMSEEMTRKFIDFKGTDDESTKDEKKDKDKGREDDDERDQDDMAGDEAPQPLFGEDPLKQEGADPLGQKRDDPETDKDEKEARSDDRNKEIERKIVELREFADDIKLRQVFKMLAQHDSQFGIGHLFLDLKGANLDDPRDPENRMDIGDGRNDVSKSKLSRNCLKGLRTIEPVWCYPTLYNATNPLHPSWYDPQVWYVMGSEIHKSRLIPLIGRPVPDILKPAYAFGGLPMTQMAQPYVDIWLRTRQSVAEIIHAFSVMVLQTNMGTTVQPGGSSGGAGDVVARMMLMNALRDNQGMMIIDKSTEDFKNISAPLGTLDQLQAQSQEHMYSVARIPAVKWTGIQPQGLNATSEGEMRAFNDTIHGYQEQLFRTALNTIVDIMMISLWGKRDPDITFDFAALHELTEKEQAEVEKMKAETAQIRVDSGIVSQEEIRGVLVADPDSDFHGLDPEDTPDLLGEEEQGLIPPGAGKAEQGILGAGGAGGPPQPGKPPGGPPQGGKGPFNAPAKPKRAPAFGKDEALGLGTAFQDAEGKDKLGYFEGLGKLEVIPDKDQWHAEYISDSDTIEVQRKLTFDPAQEIVRTLLHEAGHRGQMREDKAAFRRFKKAKLDTTEHFVALANNVHLADFRCTGHIEDKSGEIFSESYAHWCLDMPMPEKLQRFWDREGGDPMAMDAEWDESKHPRDKSGKFGSGGGGGAKKAEGAGAAKPKASHHGGPNASPQKPFAPLHPSSLTKVSGKMGSNEGGVYKDKGGQEYYVKQPKSAAHVTNENTAARLYQLTGAHTLEYMDAGPKHVATKLEKLVANNVSQMTSEEKKTAQKDFMTHAWLGNWDAAGMGGDNQGVLNGKVTTLDVGGSLLFRAQGEPKGDKWGPKVSETLTLLDSGMNPDTAALFGGMTKDEKIASAKQVTEIPNNAIREVVAAGGMDEEMANTLIARKNDIAAQVGLTPAGDTNPEWEALHPRGPGGKFVAKPGGEEPAGLGGNEPSPTPQFKTKKELVGHLLSNPDGVTMAEVLKQTGWPSVSMNAQAAAMGMKLEKKKVGGEVKYFGTPMTDAEKADLKNKAKAKLAKSAAPIAPAPPPKPAASEFPTPSPEEATKAKKGTPLKMAYIPEPKPLVKANFDIAEKIIKGFNDKWAGKELTDPKEIAQKVFHFKQIAGAINDIGAQEQKDKQAKQAVEQKKAAEELKKTQASQKGQLDAYMKELGITASEAQGFLALANMHAGSKGDLVKKFQSYKDQAGNLGLPISGFQYALLQDYIDGGYGTINKALREGVISQEQHVYTKMMNKALDAFPKFEGMLSRGTHLSNQDIARYKPGHVITHHSFTSAGEGFSFGGNVHYKIKAIGKRGANVQAVNPHEKEIIFKANTQFLVKSVETKGGKTTIELEEMEDYG